MYCRLRELRSEELEREFFKTVKNEFFEAQGVSPEGRDEPAALKTV